eukprot:428634-Karenia_brevis.AAC.1
MRNQAKLADEAIHREALRSLGGSVELADSMDEPLAHRHLIGHPCEPLSAQAPSWISRRDSQNLPTT